jgi:hypothetical protein
MSLTTPADVVRATIPGERWSATREFCDLYPIENARAEFAGNWLANVSSSARSLMTVPFHSDARAFT